MSDLNDLIAKTSVRAYNQGLRSERENIIRMLKDMKQHTECECAGCESWTNAFEFLIRTLNGEVKNG
jgi:hypothetical protein